MLAEVTERALALTRARHLLLVGGVACEWAWSHLRGAWSHLEGAWSLLGGAGYCVDNGAMIAQAGWEMLRAGQVTELGQSGITQRYRTDEVEVTWRD
ncbi:OSGEP threonylcarbamoyltransferase, partial [Dryoscopus gambensis]|nr:OSGEP threonylcarbamoyltransferase [Dryoscopus gambensis]